MTMADLLVLVRERSLARARDLVTLAWRTAYYGRVNHFPDLADELAGLEPDEAGTDEVGPGGIMSEARMWRVWGKIRTGIQAWNAEFERVGG